MADKMGTGAIGRLHTLRDPQRSTYIYQPVSFSVATRFVPVRDRGPVSQQSLGNCESTLCRKADPNRRRQQLEHRWSSFQWHIADHLQARVSGE